MPMPIRRRFILGMTLSASAGIIASGAVAPATVDAQDPPNNDKVTQQDAGHGLDWEKVAQDKRPPNG